MTRRTRSPLILVAAVLALAAPSTASAQAGRCAGADAVPSAGSLDRASAATLCLLNRERTRRGLRPLHGDRRLRSAATSFSREMVRHRFFSHVSAVSGSTLDRRVRAAGYLSGARGWRIGENIAWGSGGYATPRHTVRSWMRSPGHRANILNGAFREIGIGIARGAPRPVGGRAATYTTDFGSRR